MILTFLLPYLSLELVTSQLHQNNARTLCGRNIDVIVALGMPWVGSGNKLDWIGDQFMLE